MKRMILTICLVLFLSSGCAVISLRALEAKVALELSSEAKEKISNEIKDDLKLWIKAENQAKVRPIKITLIE